MAIPCKLMAYMVFSVLLVIMGICTIGAAAAAAAAGAEKLTGDCVDNGQKWVDAMDECNKIVEEREPLWTLGDGNNLGYLYYWDAKDFKSLLGQFATPVIGAGVVAFLFGVLGTIGAKTQNKSVVTTATVFMGVCLIGYVALGAWSGMVALVASVVCDAGMDYTNSPKGNEDAETGIHNMFEQYSKNGKGGSNSLSGHCNTVEMPKVISKDDLFGQKCDGCGKGTVQWFSCQKVMDNACGTATRGLALAGAFCWIAAVVSFVGSIIGCTACCCDDKNNSVWTKGGEEPSGDVASQ